MVINDFFPSLWFRSAPFEVTKMKGSSLVTAFMTSGFHLYTSFWAQTTPSPYQLNGLYLEVIRNGSLEGRTTSLNWHWMPAARLSDKGHLIWQFLERPPATILFSAIWGSDTFGFSNLLRSHLLNSQSIYIDFLVISVFGNVVSATILVFSH